MHCYEILPFRTIESLAGKCCWYIYISCKLDCIYFGGTSYFEKHIFSGVNLLSFLFINCFKMRIGFSSATIKWYLYRSQEKYFWLDLSWLYSILVGYICLCIHLKFVLSKEECSSWFQMVTDLSNFMVIYWKVFYLLKMVFLAPHW